MAKNLPPGFRFHPTDEELIVYYLCNQYTSNPCPASSIIPEVDIYKFDPSDLPSIKKAEFGEKEWYFFSPRERKYPNGVRPNRATVSGYWKATGTDKAIYSGSKHIGVKKSLVFYKGKPPKGIKTGWIMHEYRLVESRTSHNSNSNKHVAGSMRLDDWVLCRIYKKKKDMVEKQGLFPSNETVAGNDDDYQDHEQEIMMDNYLGSSVSQMFSDGCYNSSFPTFDLQNNNASYGSLVKPQMIFAEHNYGEDHYTGKLQGMMKQSSSMNRNQPMFGSHVYHL